jgi:hypothetical protein
MLIALWLLDLVMSPANEGRDEVIPLVAKRFEERLAQIPPAERTDEKLHEVFIEATEAASREAFGLSEPRPASTRNSTRAGR